jgi:murein DD-endopeptidase MepM/ murein hydrolase activator NlpD
MPGLEPFPGAEFFRNGQRSPIANAMGRRLVEEGCGAVPGRGVTTAYHKKGHRWRLGYHTGADYAAERGTSCVAVTSGSVRSGEDGGFGRYFVLTSGGSDCYCHLSERLVTSGSVRAGQKIGKVGDSGNATGPHLHFEKRPAGKGFGSDMTPKW